MKVLKWVLLFACLLCVVYFTGPKPASPVYAPGMPRVPDSTGELDGYVRLSESAHRIKPENEARIVWYNDSARDKTEYSVVYLHGFTASQEEGDPVHSRFAAKFGCNLYLARLSEHGLDTTDALINLTPDSYWESAKNALAIGEKIGKKVILMGTSTGCTNALQLAATFPDKVHAIILYSPNIAINDPNATLLNDPWGLQIARAVKKSDHITTTDQSEIYRKYWYSKYRLESVVALQEMLETTKENFQKIDKPVLMLYYYKDADHQDGVVKVSAMLKMFSELGTPKELKRSVAIPGAGDHVLGSYIKSKDLASVERETENFAREVLKMPYAISK
jgi:pimeloyl-ACP methyl ester carboxylesterase